MLLKITLGLFQFFSKIRGDIRKSRYTTCVNDTGGKIDAGINDRCQRRLCQRRWWQIATSINNTGGKFATVVVDTGGK
jgi:hypothetical protein